MATRQLQHIWIQPASLELAALATEQATALIPPEGENAQKLPDSLPHVARDGDFQEGRDFIRYQIQSEQDERQIDPDKLAVIEPAQWTIIPAENLIARGIQALLMVDTAEQVRLALTIMERGVAGIWLRQADAATIRATAEVLDELDPKPISMTTATITDLQPVGMGDRCCLDLIGQLEPGEGVLVGSFNHARFLLHSENVTNQFCAARPFRVNAGAVHGYVVTPGDQVRYLAEMTSGMPVLVVSPSGQTRTLAVGRNKIERRPMVRIEAEDANGQRISAILQQAETIRLVDSKHQALSINDIKPGDAVMVSTVQPTGRHFGRAIEETIDER